MAIAAATGMVSVRAVVKASWDIQPQHTLIYNPSFLKNKNPNTVQTPSPPPLTATTTTTTTLPTIKKKKKDFTASELLSLNKSTLNLEIGKSEDLHLGYERWLPVPPEVKKPRSIYNAATLAYIGDCIYELYARRHFLYPPSNIEEYNDRVMAVVRCEAQAALLKKLLDADFLSEEERDVLRWGKNISSGKTRTTKRSGLAVYTKASSLETLVGYLYLTNVGRLEELMLKLGFSVGASTQMILEEKHSKFK